MDDGGISVYFSLIHSKGVLCFLWLLSVIIFFLLSCLMCTCLELGCSELSCFAYRINSSFQTAISSFYTTHFFWPFSLATTPVMWCRMCLKHYLYHFLFTVKVKITANNQFQTPPARPLCIYAQVTPFNSHRQHLRNNLRYSYFCEHPQNNGYLAHSYADDQSKSWHWSPSFLTLGSIILTHANLRKLDCEILLGTYCHSVVSQELLPSIPQWGRCSHIEQMDNRRQDFVNSFSSFFSYFFIY